MGTIIFFINSIAVIMVLSYLITRNNNFTPILSKKITFSNQLFLILVFGIFSVYGTVGGIHILGAILNIRDLGPMIAGLFGGTIAGLGAAIIGAAYRYSVGGFTVIPCSVSTIIAGLAGGLIYFINRGRPAGVILSVCLAVLIEIIHMALILVIAQPYAKALTLVKQIAFPMIITNALGMGIFVFIFKSLTWERQT